MADKHQKDTENLAFGPYTGTIYRRTDLKDSSYFLRVYLKDEGRYLRRSLKTESATEARERAIKEIIDISAKVQSGQKVLSITLADLKRKYWVTKEAEVTQGQISKNTLAGHSYRINHGMRFLLAKGKDMRTLISNLDGKIWNEYLEWRFADAEIRGKTIRRDVVRDELLTIRQMFKWALEEKLITERGIPKWTFVVEKEGPKRQRMSQRNYLDFLNTIFFWIKDAKNERELYNRLLLRHFVLVVSNSGMRSGELFGLRNKDVEIRRDANECLITIRPETSKVRQGRQISFHGSYGGNSRRKDQTNYLIRWIDQYQIHADPYDYVFSTMDSGRVQSRDVYYHAYKLLRVKLEEKDIAWFDTYHCRHFWITNRLLAGEPIHLIAKAAGTSVAEIESTYSHVLGEMATKAFAKTIVEYDDEGGYRIVRVDEVKKAAEKAPKKKAAKLPKDPR